MHVREMTIAHYCCCCYWTEWSFLSQVNQVFIDRKIALRVWRLLAVYIRLKVETDFILFFRKILFKEYTYLFIWCVICWYRYASTALEVSRLYWYFSLQIMHYYEYDSQALYSVIFIKNCFRYFLQNLF